MLLPVHSSEQTKEHLGSPIAAARSQHSGPGEEEGASQLGKEHVLPGTSNIFTKPGNCGRNDHKITGWFGVEGTLKPNIKAQH